MAAGRSLKTLVGRRRRADEEGEDEEGSVLLEDSQSDGSTRSDLEDEEVDGSSVGEANLESADAGTLHEKTEAVTSKGQTSSKKPRKSRKKAARKQTKEPVHGLSQVQSTGFKAIADTEAMLNGLKIDVESEDTIDFDNIHQNGSTASTVPLDRNAGVNGSAHVETSGERNKRESEEARKKRDTGPAFVPSRGNFFMHDTRSQNGQGSAPVRGAWSGRGRGKGAVQVGGPFSPASQSAQADRAAEQPWKHDLHEAINEEPSSVVSQRSSEMVQDQGESTRQPSRPGMSRQSQGQRVTTFSSTTKVGTVQISVYLPGMKAPITFTDTPWKHYTRLPDHRPPLRRDKPVRVFVPQHVQRYIFPSPERSFIFIPRQMRPNQQGFGRFSHQRSIGGYGYSSRRTSMYGGSMYAASVVASRRSSFASVARETAFSPVTGSIQSSRPVVRLPHGQGPAGLQVHTFPLPQQPTYQGTPTTMVHQPRPQKAISVTGIESPAALQQTSAPEAQPFQNQLPAHMHEQTAYMQPQLYQSPGQTFTYPPQQQTGTPLSGIPEQAIHASAFQPPGMAYGQSPYYPAYPQQGFYYPHAANNYQHMPMYIGPPQGYMMSAPGPAMTSQQQAPPPQPMPQASESEQQQQQQSQHRPQPSQSQSGMVAHESNGMVYYLPASEAQQQPHGETYQPAESFVPSYAMPGLPPPTPAPEATYYYPPQMHAMYHPGQP